MTQREWFQMIDQEKPDLLRNVWEWHLCSCAHETNVLIARDLTMHAKLRGDDVVLTVAGWRHYRVAHDMVSKHRQEHQEEIAPPLTSDPIAIPITPHLKTSAQAIAALQQVISFLQRFGGFGIQEPSPLSHAIDTLFGKNGVFTEKEPHP